MNPGQSFLLLPSLCLLWALSVVGPQHLFTDRWVACWPRPRPVKEVGHMARLSQAENQKQMECEMLEEFARKDRAWKQANSHL